jgi:hypothetical protein
MPQQPDLFSDKPTGRLTNQEQFDAWIASVKGQAVYREVCGLARQLRAQGYNKYGIGAIYEYMRFSRSLAQGAADPDGFKLNNTLRAYLSRYIMDREIDLMDFFTTKKQSAE